MTTSITLRATKGSALTHAEMDANLTNLQTTADAAKAASDTLTASKAEATALGVSNTDQNMGSFTGSTISDNVSAKVGMQALETAVETKATAAALGVTASAANMGTYTGSTISDNQTAKQNLQEIETAVEARPTSATLAASGGSALIGFLQSGTGAVARTAQAKMRDFVSVKDFDAVGDGVTADGTAFTNAAASLTNGGAIDVPAGSYKAGAQLLGPARGNVHKADYAVTGTTDILTNGTFTGSPATGWTLSNFTSTNPGLSHTAGTVASASRSITVVDGQNYLIRVTLTTTTAGTGTLYINGQPMLSATDLFGLPVASSYTYDFPYLANGVSGAITFEFRSNIEWAGSISEIKVLAVTQDAPYDFFSISADNKTFTNPFGIKFGRYLSGNISIGDRSTSANFLTGAAWNVAMGSRALSVITSGIENTANGSLALEYYQGDQATAVGYSALRCNKSGAGLTGIGFKVLGLNNGSRNSGLGYLAGLQSATGNDLCLVGYQAGYAAKGSSLTIVGSQAGQQLNGGDANTYVGATSGPYNATSTNLFTYSYQTLIGAGSKGYGSYTVAIGGESRCGSDTYSGGTAIATSAVAIGYTAVANADESVVIGGAATVSTATHVRSTIVGTSAQGLGDQSAAFGYLTEARQYDVAIGSQAGRSLTGTQNTSVGTSANNFSGGAQAYTNTTSLGFNALATGSNQVTLGNASVTELRAPGPGFKASLTDFTLNKTVTAGGTTGAQTIQKPAGSVNFAAAAASLVVTNGLVTANSIIIATVATNDATMKSVAVVAGAGSFTLHADAAATGETRVNYLVIN